MSPPPLSPVSPPLCILRRSSCVSGFSSHRLPSSFFLLFPCCPPPLSDILVIVCLLIRPREKKEARHSRHSRHPHEHTHSHAHTSFSSPLRPVVNYFISNVRPLSCPSPFLVLVLLFHSLYPSSPLPSALFPPSTPSLLHLLILHLPSHPFNVFPPSTPLTTSLIVFASFCL